MKYLLLGAIIFLGFVLRILFLEQWPVGVTADEIQQGYSAYSILKTGKDEWGDFLPLNPRSFGDFKPPLYSYLIIPFEWIFGLNLLAIRLPSAVSGVLTIFVVYLLGKRIFGSQRIGLISALMLAISSWHVIYSRIGWESNVGILLFAMGLLFFILGKDKNHLLIFSALFFGLTLFTYHSFKVLTPLFIVGLIFLYREQFRKIGKKWLLRSLIVFLIFFISLGVSWIFFGAGKRASDAAIYNPENLNYLREIQFKDGLPQPWNRVVNNKIAYIFSQFSQNYLGYFSTTFLTSPHRSDNSVFNLSGRELVPPWQFLLFIVGVFLLLKSNEKDKKILLLWLLLSPIPAALTRDYMQTLRVESYLLAIPVVSAFGLENILVWVRKQKYKIAISFSILGIIFYSFVSDVDYYLFHHFKNEGGGIKYGYKATINYLKENEGRYEKIFFTKRQSMPHIFLSFYTKMDPNYFQQNSKNWLIFEKNGLKYLDMIDYDLGKYKFKSIDWGIDKNSKNSLIISSEEHIPEEIKPFKIITDPSGKVLFKFYETNSYD